MTTRCILCNVEDDVCLVLSDCETFHCKACGSEFTVADLEEHVGGLRKMLCVAKAAKAAAEKE